jgi:hypothetical protein
MTGVGAASFPIHRSRIVIARIFRERAPWHESNGGHDACPGSRLLGIRYSGTDSRLRAMRAVDRLETVLTAIALAISLDIVQERASAAVITVHPWLLSVTERPVLPPQ